MITLLSPAKTLDYKTLSPHAETSIPDFIDDSALLIERCQQLSPVDVSNLMKVSDKIASLNVARFSQWQIKPTQENAKSAIFAFKGDVYIGLQAESLTSKQIRWTQSNLRILSGLYGLLKPLDLMQPYRLEMGTKLDNVRGKNLYEFWGDRITDKINLLLENNNQAVVVNLASNEYFKSVNQSKLNATLITPIFKDYKNGVYEIISFHAKKARGMMARYIIDQQITKIQQLESFDSSGYWFDPSESTATELVFKRDH